jgi:hypothetical protein
MDLLHVVQDEKKHASYLLLKQGVKIGNYHNNLIKSIIELDKSSLTYTNRNGEVFFDIDVYFKNKLHL